MAKKSSKKSSRENIEKIKEGFENPKRVEYIVVEKSQSQTEETTFWNYYFLFFILILFIAIAVAIAYD